MEYHISEVNLIIHADDAGLSNSVNLATMDAMRNGIVSSASVLVTAPGFLEFAEYARSYLAGDYGVHLALTSEWENYPWGPVTDRSTVGSLIDSTGAFWNEVALVAKYVLVEHAEIELSNQVEKALAEGIPISHLDAHEGVLFSRPDFAEMYVRLSNRYNLPILVFDSVFDVASVGPALRNALRNSFGEFPSYPYPVLSSVEQIYSTAPHEERRAAYLELFRHLPTGFNQMIVHCGVDGTELRSITRMSGLRNSDYRLMHDPLLKNEINRLRIKLTNWRELAEAATRPTSSSNRET